MLFSRGRRDRLDAAIEEMAENRPCTPMVCRLGCIRGISTLTAFELEVEIGDWQCFPRSTIGSYLEQVPSEYSSGTPRSQGLITQAGNDRARRLFG
jgi:transposase